MRSSATARASAPCAQTPALLKGLIFGPTGAAMTPSDTRRNGKLYRYYVSTDVLKRDAESCPIRRVPAGDIETAVIDQLRGLLRAPEIVVRAWRAARQSGEDISEGEVREALERLDPLWDQLFPAEQARIVQLLVERVDIRPDYETCEDCRCAVTLVIVGAPLDLTRTHRQKRLRSIKGLYLALFIDADDQRLVRRIEIEADNVAHLLNELRIGRQLERLRAMRLQAEGLPDPMYGRRRYARRLRHAARAPVRRVRGLCFERLCDNLLDPVIADLAWCTASRLVVEAVKAMLREPLAPRSDGLARDARRICDLAVVQPIGCAQNDLGALRIMPSHGWLESSETGH